MATTVSFLFWNIRRAVGTRFRESLRRLAHAGLDVILLAEPPADDASLLDAINGGPGGTYYRVPSTSRRLMLFSRLRDARWKDRFVDETNDRITAHELELGDHPSLLLVGAHFQSPNHLSAADRAEWARFHRRDILRIEKDAKHGRTLLVGDLNMNPFDAGIVETTALHALMSRSMVASVRRMKSRREHPPFYNPMWSLMGDRDVSRLGTRTRPAGSYFYGGAQALSGHFWQMYDQVLLRPDIMDWLTRLEILDSDGHNRLVTRSGRPRRRAISDHLPLRFDLLVPGGGH